MVKSGWGCHGLSIPIQKLPETPVVYGTGAAEGLHFKFVENVGWSLVPAAKVGLLMMMYNL